jgi:hypothetical protein
LNLLEIESKPKYKTIRSYDRYEKINHVILEAVVFKINIIKTLLQANRKKQK